MLKGGGGNDSLFGGKGKDTDRRGWRRHLCTLIKEGHHRRLLNCRRRGYRDTRQPQPSSHLKRQLPSTQRLGEQHQNHAAQRQQRRPSAKPTRSNNLSNYIKHKFDREAGNRPLYGFKQILYKNEVSNVGQNLSLENHQYNTKIIQ